MHYELIQIPLEVFIKIAYFVDNVNTLRSLRQVCKSAKKACEHVKTLKLYQFQRLYIVGDGNNWKIFDNETLAKDFLTYVLQVGNRQLLACDDIKHSCFSVQRQDILSMDLKHRVYN
jgi:hypothetical protein